MLKDLLLRNRSYRRFEQEVRISEEELTELVGLTCLCASARNAQALKYVIVHEEEKCAEVFPQLAWAGYLKDWDGPEEGERPAAYLIQLLDTRIVENGWGGCIIKAFRNEDLRRLFHLPEELKINYVIALGKPKEKVVLEQMKGEDYRYWRDADGVHHVPKREAGSLIYKIEV